MHDLRPAPYTVYGTNTLPNSSEEVNMGDFILIYFAVAVLLWCVMNTILLPAEPSKKEHTIVTCMAIVWPVAVLVWAACFILTVKRRS